MNMSICAADLFLIALCSMSMLRRHADQFQLFFLDALFVVLMLGKLTNQFVASAGMNMLAIAAARRRFLCIFCYFIFNDLVFDRFILSHFVFIDLSLSFFNFRSLFLDDFYRAPTLEKEAVI